MLKTICKDMLSILVDTAKIFGAAIAVILLVVIAIIIPALTVVPIIEYGISNGVRAIPVIALQLLGLLTAFALGEYMFEERKRWSGGIGKFVFEDFWDYFGKNVVGVGIGLIVLVLIALFLGLMFVMIQSSLYISAWLIPLLPFLPDKVVFVAVFMLVLLFVLFLYVSIKTFVKSIRSEKDADKD